MRNILSAILCLIALPALGQNKECGNRTRAELVEMAQKDVERFEQLVEGVPPADAAWLDQEFAAAINDRNRARLRLVMRHQYFRANEARKLMREYTAALETTKNPNSPKRQAINMARALGLAYRTASALEEYADDDARRADRVVKDREDFALMTGFMPTSLSRALTCTIGLLRDPV